MQLTAVRPSAEVALEVRYPEATRGEVQVEGAEYSASRRGPSSFEHATFERLQWCYQLSALGFQPMSAADS